MDFVIGLAIGLTVGWLLNWVVEPLLGRRAGQAGEQATEYGQALIDLQQRMSAIEAVLSGGRAQDNLTSGGRTITKVILREKDDLESIKGIGPVFAERLNEAGVYTFEQLAGTSPEHLRQHASPKEFQEVDVDSWIEQARELASQSAR